MSDPYDPNVPDPENPDPDAPEQPAQTGAVYPVNDGKGGTAFTIGTTSEQATFEQWAAQNGVAVPPKGDDEDVEYDADGNPIDPDEEEPQFGTIEGTEAERVSAISAAADDLNE